jgi:hypothetical protein
LIRQAEILVEEIFKSGLVRVARKRGEDILNKYVNVTARVEIALD